MILYNSYLIFFIQKTIKKQLQTLGSYVGK